MTDINARCFWRDGNALKPVDIHADEWLGTLPYHKELLISVRQPRSPRHHRWYFAMLRKVVRATGTWRNEAELLDAIKLDLGHYELRRDITGRVYQAPRSISFAKMKQDEFKLFAERSIDAIATATGIDPEALMREVEEEQGPLAPQPEEEKV